VSLEKEVRKMDSPSRLRNGDAGALVWYDFICPFCYVGQQRTRILADAGVSVAQLPFQAHPDIPIEGVAAGPRTGPMYAMLAREAADAGLPLTWPSRLPNTRLALTAAEWLRDGDQARFARLHERLFAAHFANGEDLGDPAVIDRHLRFVGADPLSFWTAVDDGSAQAAVDEAEALGRSLGVQGTPAWLVGQRLINGLMPALEFERLAGDRQQAAV
jgi:predicted DsbA family dithiol-disulfide isomerase